MAYTSLELIREAGITVEMASDALVQSYIPRWELIIDRVTGQWFDRREVSFWHAGRGHSLMLFDVPIIEITEILDFETNTPVPPEDVQIFSRIGPIDDRRNPRIKRKGSCDWEEEHEYRFTGAFGFVEADGSTPADLVYAATKLVTEKLLAQPVVNQQGSVAAIHPEAYLKRYMVDAMNMEFENAAPKMTSRRAWYSGITMDKEIQDILRMYRRPQRVR